MDTNQNKIWTVIDIINWGADFFKSKGIESPRLSIELLLCHVLKFERIDIYLQHDKPLTKSELDLLHSLVRRKSNREPIQYILGKSQFYGIEFLINNKVLIPRPETEILVDEALKIIRNYEYPVILDIGTGCGNIAVTIAAKNADSEIVAIDNNPDAINLAKKNAGRYNLKNIKFILSDILKEIPNQKFDVIVSNPPYINTSEYLKLMPEILNYEPAEALTDHKDGLTFYERFAEIFPVLLNKKGYFLVEIGYEQSEIVYELFTKKGFKTEFIQDYNKMDRICAGTIYQ